MARHSDRFQEPMDPESVPSRLVATHHLRLGRQPEALLRSLDFDLQSVRVPRPYGPLPGSLPHARGEAQFPLPPPQLKRQEQRPVTFSSTGRLRVLHRSSWLQ